MPIMKTAIWSLFCCLLCVNATVAEETGKVLILDNEQLIEGDIRREGERYFIRRGSGETVIPATRVIELVGSRADAYRVMRERCNRRDLDDRLHLVRWCLDNGFRKEALAEAEQILPYRPTDTRLRSLVEGLRQLDQPRVSTPTTPPARLPDKVIELEALDYNQESFGLFVSKVQPILMNLCVRCHGIADGGKFQLINVADGGNRKATLFNLASTLRQLKRDDLAASPLLEKAVTAHGKAMQPPLRDRQALAYQYLEAWVLAAVNPEAAPPTVVPVKAEIPEPLKPVAKSPFAETSTSQAKPEPQTQAKDPFDPAIFNGTIEKK